MLRAVLAPLLPPLLLNAVAPDVRCVFPHLPVVPIRGFAATEPAIKVTDWRDADGLPYRTEEALYRGGDRFLEVVVVRLSREAWGRATRELTAPPLRQAPVLSGRGLYLGGRRVQWRRPPNAPAADSGTYLWSEHRGVHVAVTGFNLGVGDIERVISRLDVDTSTPGQGSLPVTGAAARCWSYRA